MEKTNDGRQKCDMCGKMVNTVFIVGWGFAPPYVHRVCPECYDELKSKESAGDDET